MTLSLLEEGIQITEMTAFDEALTIDETIEDNKWKLAGKLFEAVEIEGHTLREFAIARNGNPEREDTYSNYYKAEAFRITCLNLPEYETLMQLPISYWYTAARSKMDFEDIIEKMLDCFLKDGRKGQRWLAAQLNPDKGKTFEDLLKTGRNWVEKIKPIAIGKQEAMDTRQAKRARRIVRLLVWLERVLEEE